MKTKLITLALAFSFLTFPVIAQEKVKSEIVMTKEELKSFLQTIVDAKRKSLENKKDDVASTDNNDLDYQIKVLENRLDQAKQRKQSSDRNGNISQDNVSNSELLREIQRLNDRLYYVEMDSNGRSNKGSNTTVLTPGSNGYNPNQAIGNLPTPPLNAELMEAKAKLDSLQRLAAQNSVGQDNLAYQTELQRINQQLDLLQSSLKSEPSTDYSVDQLKAKYKNYKKTVFFAHNSVVITADALAEIKAVANLLDDNDRINVLVKGFASKVGNPVYNNDLSMRRTQAVKTALVSEGVSIDQIITIFHGEDFTTSDADARRVDMTLQIVR